MRKRNEASEKFDASREIHTNQTKVARHWPGRRANTLLSIATKSQPQSIRIRFNSWNNIKLIWYRINISFLVEFIFDLLQSLMSFCIIDDFSLLDSTAVANGNTSERARSLKVHTRNWMWFIYLNARFICITLTALLANCPKYSERPSYGDKRNTFNFAIHPTTAWWHLMSISNRMGIVTDFVPLNSHISLTHTCLVSLSHKL